MIYTVTLNPAIDYYMIVDNKLIDDEVNRTKEDYFKVGGKGLNVSRVLETLGVENTAIALIGGFTGEYIRNNYSNHHLVKFVGIDLNGNTRINTKIYSSNQTICVNSNGPSATDETKKAIFNSLEELCDKDTVMICGKACKGIDDSFMNKLCEFIHERHSFLVIDMENLDINKIQMWKPDLIKPNRYELNLILKDSSSLEDQASTLLQNGLSSILVSLGKDGAYYSNGKETYSVSQPEINVVNKVGCGDSMLATFVGILEKTKDIEVALRYATAAGCATASTLKDITLEDIEKLVESIQVEKR